MESRVVYSNPLAGVVKKIHFHDDGAMTLQETRDETLIVEENKAIHNLWTSLDRYGDGKIVLRGVPQPLIDDWKKRGWWNRENFFRCLNDERAQKYKVFGK